MLLISHPLSGMWENHLWIFVNKFIVNALSVCRSYVAHYFIFNDHFDFRMSWPYTAFCYTYRVKLQNDMIKFGLIMAKFLWNLASAHFQGCLNLIRPFIKKAVEISCDKVISNIPPNLSSSEFDISPLFNHSLVQSSYSKWIMMYCLITSCHSGMLTEVLDTTTSAETLIISTMMSGVG